MGLYNERDKEFENAFNQVYVFQILEQVESDEQVPHSAMDKSQFQLTQPARNSGHREIFTIVIQSIQISGVEERLRIFYSVEAGV